MRKAFSNRFLIVRVNSVWIQRIPRGDVFGQQSAVKIDAVSDIFIFERGLFLLLPPPKIFLGVRITRQLYGGKPHVCFAVHFPPALDD